MAKLLRNYYWESQLDNYLEREKIEKRLESKSELLRGILKERYNLCQVKNCFAISLSNGFCQFHNNLKFNKDIGKRVATP